MQSPEWIETLIEPPKKGMVRAKAMSYESLEGLEKAEPKLMSFIVSKGWQDFVAEGILTSAKCFEIAATFSSKTSWRYDDPLSFKNAKAKNIDIECCQHMEQPNRTVLSQEDLAMTDESIQESAMSFLTLAEWQHYCPSEFRLAKDRGIVADCKQHMKTKRDVVSVARMYDSELEFKSKEPAVYSSAQFNDWMSSCLMAIKTYNECIAIAISCNSERDFYNTSSEAYQAATAKGWLEICREYAASKRQCIKKASLCRTLEEWEATRFSEKAVEKKWTEECRKYVMTEELLIEKILAETSLTGLKRNRRVVYQVAKERGYEGALLHAYRPRKDFFRSLWRYESYAEWKENNQDMALAAIWTKCDPSLQSSAITSKDCIASARGFSNRLYWKTTCSNHALAASIKGVLPQCMQIININSGNGLRPGSNGLSHDHVALVEANH